MTPIETESWGERYVQMVDPNGVVYQFVQWTADTGAGEAASLQSS